MAVNAIPDTPSDVVAKLLAQYNQLQADVASLTTKYNAAVTLINELKADHNAHLGAANMHYDGTGGTTDAVNTTAATNATAASVAAQQVGLLE